MRFPLATGRLLGLLTLLVALAAPARAAVFDPTTFTLANGLQVVVVENDRAPVVSHMVFYKVGAADEPKGKSGIAHFLEHLMFKGTDTVAPGEFSAIIKRIGGQENAFTSYDYTGYYQNVAKQHLGRMMELESDRMANLKLPADQIAPELEVVREERRSRIDNDPSSLHGEQVMAATYLAYPYRIPIIGWEDEVAALTQEDAEAFYRTWYAPNNAVLVVAGDVTPDEVRRLAQKTYGQIPAREVPDRVALRGGEPTQLAERRIEGTHPRVDQPTWSRRWIAPGQVWGDTDLAPALEVAAEILGGGSTSRLYRALVVEQAKAVYAGAGYGPSGLGPQTFAVYASPRADVSVEELEDAMEAEIARMLRDGVTAEEVESAVTRMKRSAVFARDDSLAPARLFGAELASGGTIADVEEWPERIGAVTPDAVVTALRAVIVDPHSVTSILRPEPRS
ncbi:M16 family metallopeptidase [Thalassobaculum salexigens]|uniref:M16 family metallopeptidase n=1 Tax=Thalassobaculum salexigens TaxID=455360 RepID=UPI0003FC8D83|nr:pitrilysin family protein [Thalassobaculum salexigens]